MSYILFNSKGIRSSHKYIMILCDVILLIMGIAGVFISQMKHDTYTVSFSTTAGHSLGSGDFGGGYVLNENARNSFLTISVILIILALIFFEFIIMANKSYINVFDDHIEAMQCIAFFVIIKKPINLTYDKIQDIEYIKPVNALSTDKIVIYTSYGKKLLVVKETEKAYELIKNLIQHANGG